MLEVARVPIARDPDIVLARQRGRALAAELGFNGVDLALIATAISELARNILQYAREGEILLLRLEKGARKGICVVAVDAGPGIADVERALQDGYSTSSGMGLGLPGVRRLMDELEIDSALGRGTRITARKWAE